MIDIDVIENIVRLWPAEHIDNLCKRYYLWCYCILRYEGSERRKWLEKIITTLDESDIKGMIRHFLHRNDLTEEMISMLGYFLPDDDDDYVDLSRRAEPNVIQNCDKWCSNHSKNSLENLFRRS